MIEAKIEATRHDYGHVSTLDTPREQLEPKI